MSLISVSFCGNEPRPSYSILATCRHSLPTTFAPSSFLSRVPRSASLATDTCASLTSVRPLASRALPAVPSQLVAVIASSPKHALDIPVSSSAPSVVTNVGSDSLYGLLSPPKGPRPAHAHDSRLPVPLHSPQPIRHPSITASPLATTYTDSFARQSPPRPSHPLPSPPDSTVSPFVSAVSQYHAPVQNVGTSVGSSPNVDHATYLLPCPSPLSPLSLSPGPASRRRPQPSSVFDRSHYSSPLVQYRYTPQTTTNDLPPTPDVDQRHGPGSAYTTTPAVSIDTDSQRQRHFTQQTTTNDLPPRHSAYGSSSMPATTPTVSSDSDSQRPRLNATQYSPDDMPPFTNLDHFVPRPSPQPRYPSSSPSVATEPSYSFPPPSQSRQSLDGRSSWKESCRVTAFGSAAVFSEAAPNVPQPPLFTANTVPQSSSPRRPLPQPPVFVARHVSDHAPPYRVPHRRPQCPYPIPLSHELSASPSIVASAYQTRNSVRNNRFDVHHDVYASQSCPYPCRGAQSASESPGGPHCVHSVPSYKASSPPFPSRRQRPTYLRNDVQAPQSTFPARSRPRHHPARPRHAVAATDSPYASPSQYEVPITSSDRRRPRPSTAQRQPTVTARQFTDAATQTVSPVPTPSPTSPPADTRLIESEERLNDRKRMSESDKSQTTESTYPETLEVQTHTARELETVQNSSDATDTTNASETASAPTYIRRLSISTDTDASDTRTLALDTIASISRPRARSAPPSTSAPRSPPTVIRNDHANDSSNDFSVPDMTESITDFASTTPITSDCVSDASDTDRSETVPQQPSAPSYFSSSPHATVFSSNVSFSPFAAAVSGPCTPVLAHPLTQSPAAFASCSSSEFSYPPSPVVPAFSCSPSPVPPPPSNIVSTSVSPSTSPAVYRSTRSRHATSTASSSPPSSPLSISNSMLPPSPSIAPSSPLSSTSSSPLSPTSPSPSSFESISVPPSPSAPCPSSPPSPSSSLFALSPTVFSSPLAPSDAFSLSSPSATTLSLSTPSISPSPSPTVTATAVLPSLPSSPTAAVFSLTCHSPSAAVAASPSPSHSPSTTATTIAAASPSLSPSPSATATAVLPLSPSATATAVLPPAIASPPTSTVVSGVDPYEFDRLSEDLERTETAVRLLLVLLAGSNIAAPNIFTAVSMLTGHEYSLSECQKVFQSRTTVDS